MRRSPDDPLYPGIWQFVTGTMGDGETALAAALRELKEETGRVPGSFWVVPFVNSFYDHVHDAVNHCPFFAAEFLAEEEPTLSPEHVAYEWLPLDQATRRLVWQGQRQGLAIVHDWIVQAKDGGELARIRV